MWVMDIQVLLLLHDDDDDDGDADSVVQSLVACMDDQDGGYDLDAYAENACLDDEDVVVAVAVHSREPCPVVEVVEDASHGIEASLPCWTVCVVEPAHLRLVWK